MKRGLDALIRSWFAETSGNRRRWSATKVGRVIKQELQRLGHWKGLPRGAPAKGRLAAKKNAGF